VIHVDFHPRGATINARYYSDLLHNDVHQAVRKKKPTEPLKKIVLMHDMDCSHTANFREVTLTTMDWEIMNIPLTALT
jgi:hypothetical protein